MSNKAKKVSKPGDFKKNKNTEIELPSGNVCIVRRPGLRGIIGKTGKVPNALAPILEKAVNGAGTPDADKAGQEMTEAVANMDVDQLVEAMEFMDYVVVACVVQPEVHMPPETEADRDDEKLYIDEVDEQDKSFIMNWAFGGTSDLEKFRQQQSEFVDAVSAVTNVEQGTG